jgi:hypothetical protein
MVSADLFLSHLTSKAVKDAPWPLSTRPRLAFPRCYGDEQNWVFSIRHEGYTKVANVGRSPVLGQTGLYDETHTLKKITHLLDRIIR